MASSSWDVPHIQALRPDIAVVVVVVERNPGAAQPVLVWDLSMTKRAT